MLLHAPLNLENGLGAHNVTSVGHTPVQTQCSAVQCSAVILHHRQCFEHTPVQAQGSAVCSTQHTTTQSSALAVSRTAACK